MVIKACLKLNERLPKAIIIHMDPNNIKEGRAFLTQSEIDNAMKNATHTHVDEKGKINPCTGK